MDPRGLVTAIRTLTAIPVGGKDVESFSESLIWFPLVGLFLGLISWALGAVWNITIGPPWPGGGALVILSAQILLTRALHMDGIADWADALGASREKERRLSIMKDPHLGSFGVIALAVDILARWAVLERLFALSGIAVVVPVCVISRAAMVSLMTSLSYARAGEGMARPFLSGVSPGKRRIARGISLFVCLFFGPVGIGLFVAGWMIGWILRLSYKRAFGGITGDLLGAGNEIVEILLLWGCAGMGNSLRTYLGWSALWS